LTRSIGFDFSLSSNSASSMSMIYSVLGMKESRTEQ
jgi:hypothetical protein